jgi:hypothetical protein
MQSNSPLFSVDRFVVFFFFFFLTSQFGLLAAYGIANALYAYGGKFVVLLVVLMPLKAALETTGLLHIFQAFRLGGANKQTNKQFYFHLSKSLLANLASHFPFSAFQLANHFFFPPNILFPSTRRGARTGDWSLLIGKQSCHLCTLVLASHGLCSLGHGCPILSLGVHSIRCLCRIHSLSLLVHNHCTCSHYDWNGNMVMGLFLFF